jgi:hypothetical protein
MTTYGFTLVLGGIPEIPAEATDAEFYDRINAMMDEICGAVLAAGCDDASLSSRGQMFVLDFDREAESLGKAIGSAIEDVEKAGYKVARVEVEETAAVG